MRCSHCSQRLLLGETLAVLARSPVRLLVRRSGGVELTCRVCRLEGARRARFQKELAAATGPLPRNARARVRVHPRP